MENTTDKTRYNRGKNPNSLKNLKPFRKGNCANPTGRPPKDVSLTSLLKKYIDEIPERVKGKVNTKTWRELLVEAWLIGAYKGNTVFFKELLERLDGKVPQSLTGEGGGPISVTVTVSSERAKELTNKILKGEGTEDEAKG